MADGYRIAVLEPEEVEAFVADLVGQGLEVVGIHPDIVIEGRQMVAIQHTI